MYECRLPGAHFLIINSVHGAAVFGSEYCIKALAETFATLRAFIYTLQTPDPDAEEVKKMLNSEASKKIFDELSAVTANLKRRDAYTEDERCDFKADGILSAEGRAMYYEFKGDGTPAKDAYKKVYKTLARECCKP